MTDSLKENGEDGRDNLGGGGNKSDNRNTEDEDKKETLEDLDKRIQNLISTPKENGASKHTIDLFRQEITYLVNTESKKGTKLLSDVMRNIKNLKEIRITGRTVMETSRDTINMVPTKIEFSQDQFDNTIAIGEELFHASQFEDKSSYKTWGVGNYEVEAKVYDYLVWKELELDSLALPSTFTKGLLNAISDFLDVQNTEKYDSLINMVKKMPGGAYKDMKYKTITPQESLIHIPGRTQTKRNEL